MDIGLFDNDEWWVWVDSNHRPHPYQGCALTKLSYRPIKMGMCILPLESNLDNYSLKIFK
jgi:hypothetical protein